MRLTTFQCISFATPRHPVHFLALLCHHSTKHYHAIAEHILTSLCHCGAVRYPSLLYRYNTSLCHYFHSTRLCFAIPRHCIAVFYVAITSLRCAFPSLCHTSQCKSILCFSPLNNTLAVPRLALPLQHNAIQFHSDTTPLFTKPLLHLFPRE